MFLNQMAMSSASWNNKEEKGSCKSSRPIRTVHIPVIVVTNSKWLENREFLVPHIHAPQMVGLGESEGGRNNQ